MHKQFKGSHTWAGRRKLLLFVLFCAIILRGISLYYLTGQNKQLARTFSSHVQMVEQRERIGQINNNLQQAILLLSAASPATYKSAEIAAGKLLAVLPDWEQQLQLTGAGPASLSNYINWVHQQASLVRSLMGSADGPARSATLSLLQQNLNDPARSTYEQQLTKGISEADSHFRENGNLINSQAYTSAIMAFVTMVFIFYILLREIRHRKEINEDLLTQKEYFNTTINSIAEGMITTGPAGEIRFMNRAAETILGWKTEEVKGKPLEKVYTVINETTGQPFENIVSRILKTGRIVAFENNTILRTQDNRQRIISNYGSPIFDANNNISGTVLVFADISERKKMENQLRENKKKYKDLVEQAADGIFLFTPDGDFLSVNPCGCSMLGYTEKELLAMNISHFIPPAFSQKKLVDLAALQPGLPVQLERQFLNREGNAFYTEVRAQFTPEGNIQAIVRDITTRKRAEEQMQRMMERYEIISRATSDTIWDWDIVHNNMTFNNGITAMFGYDRSEVNNVMEWWKQHIHPDDIEAVNTTLHEMFSKGLEYAQMNYRFRCDDGSYKYIFDRAFLTFDAHGKPLRMTGAMQDITYQKEEEKQIAKATLQAQENERQQIGIELHDNVNQILVGALLNLGMIKQVPADKAGVLLDKSRGYITDAIEEIRKLSHRLSPVSMHDMALKELCCNLLQAINIENQYNIRFHMDEFPEGSVSEEIQVNLYRILQEQLNNIVKHAHATSIRVNMRLDRQSIRLLIADNGKGFLPSDGKKGIGLNNMRKRAESFSGNFSLRTAPGKGCEIMVEIPLEPAPHPVPLK